MAELLCPNCGKSNPDFLDVCQFCQTPLKPESVLRIGEKPTKKNTGELEPILPDWLRDVRQQARNAAEEEAAEAETHSKTQSNQPPDLLAGLASQAGSGEEEDVPDWLASLNPTDQSKSLTPSAPEPVSETPQEDAPSWMKGMRDQVPAPAEKDELSEWLAKASEGPEEIAESAPEQSDTGWGSPFDLPSASTSIPPAKEEEDLSWLHNLEAAAKQTGELETPKQATDWKSDFEMPSTTSQPSASDAASQPTTVRLE